MNLYFIFIVCNFFGETYGTYDEILKFELKTARVDRVLLGDRKWVAWYSEPEDCQKLCFYAAVTAKLPWVDFSYVPYWQKNLSATPVEDDYYYGMLCKGLPDFYLFRRITPGNLIQIRLVRSAVDHYKFENSEMSLVKPITFRGDLYEKFRDTDFNHMGLDDRNYLCTLASMNTENRLYFVDGVVGTARPYEFEFADDKITDIAIPCPTSPKSYLRRGDVRNTIQLVISNSGIDEYNFEKDALQPTAVFQGKCMLSATEGRKSDIFDNVSQLKAEDRIRLCTLARQWNGLTTLDTDRDVTKAQMYTFQYSDGELKEEHNVAILCPIMPLLYLRLVDKNKIKLTFSPLESYFRVSGIQVVYMIYPKNKKDKTEEERLQLHLFTNLDEETRWRICHIAQKYILQPENHIHFRSTSFEVALFPFRLLLTPNTRSMDAPNLQVILTGSQDKRFEDVVYKCTRWPEMYIRLGTSKDEIQIILLEEEILLSYLKS